MIIKVSLQISQSLYERTVFKSFCPTNSPKSMRTIYYIEDEENQQIFTFEKLEAINFLGAFFLFFVKMPVYQLQFCVPTL